MLVLPMVPGDTALMRMGALMYSMAMDLVIITMAPLVML